VAEEAPRRVAAARLLLPQGWLFLDRHPVEPLSIRQLNRDVHAEPRRLGSRSDWHSVRSNTAPARTSWNGKDIDIRVIQVLLDHASSTTQRLTRSGVSIAGAARCNCHAV
jgi:hypothetical protein